MKLDTIYGVHEKPLCADYVVSSIPQAKISDMFNLYD